MVQKKPQDRKKKAQPPAGIELLQDVSKMPLRHKRAILELYGKMTLVQQLPETEQAVQTMSLIADTDEVLAEYALDPEAWDAFTVGPLSDVMQKVLALLVWITEQVDPTVGSTTS